MHLEAEAGWQSAGETARRAGGARRAQGTLTEKQPYPYPFGSSLYRLSFQIYNAPLSVKFNIISKEIVLCG